MITMAPPIKPILRYPGGKWRLAEWIVGHMPAHRSYLEPFCGSAAVLFTKPRAALECINDLDGDIVNFFTVLRDRPGELADAIQLTPYARGEYDRSMELADDPLERARRWLVRCNFSRAGKLGSISGMRVGADGIRIRTFSGCPARTWTRMPPRIIAAAERFIGVQIESRPALEVISGWSGSGCLIYADPPYVENTLVVGDERREAAGRWARYYRHTMTDDDHRELIESLQSHNGPVLLSGYRSEIYDELLTDWTRFETAARAYNNAKRVECLWLNPVAAATSRQPGLSGMVS